MRKGMKLIREYDNGCSGLLRLSPPEAPAELGRMSSERRGKAGTHQQCFCQLFRLPLGTLVFSLSEPSAGAE